MMVTAKFNPQPLRQSRDYTIDIIFFLFSIGDYLFTVVLRSNIPQVACMSLYPEKTGICNHVENSAEVLDILQKQAAKYMICTRFLEQVPSVVLLLFWGAWSDSNSRKLPMLLPPIGMVLGIMLYLAGNFTSKYSLTCFILGSCINGIAGRTSMFCMAIYSYITDITDFSERLLRIALLTAWENLGRFIGAFIAGMLLGTAHISVSYGTALFISIIVIIAILFLKEKRSVKTDETMSKKASIGIKYFKDSVVVLLKKRQFNLRAHICMLMLVLFLHEMAVFGCFDTMILYTELPPLSWPPSTFGYLIAYNSAAMGIFIMIFIPVLSKTLNVSDLVISKLGSLSGVFQFLVFALSKHVWMIWVATTVGSLRGIVVGPIRSVLSQCVHKDEIGKMFAVLGSGFTVAHIFGLIYPALYSVTLDIFPGSSFILASALYATMSLLLLYVHLNINDSLRNSEECELFLEELTDSDEVTSE